MGVSGLWPVVKLSHNKRERARSPINKLVKKSIEEVMKAYPPPHHSIREPG